MGRHPFSAIRLRAPLSDQDKRLAIERGDHSLLIETHMRLGCSIAKTYVAYGGDVDEMNSAAMLGVVYAVKRLPMEHENPTGYISKFVHQFCAEALRTDRSIPIPRGQSGPMTITSNGTETSKDMPYAEIKEILSTLPKSDREIAVLLLLSRGYSIIEIAGKLKISQPTVSRTRQILLTRYWRQR